MDVKTRWYKEAVVYQIYPFSYMDSDGDGMGDIPGIISRLDYIKDLGVTAIWFSPLYESPLKDYGYDISDYRAINHRFGTMEDFEELIRQCHRRDIKVIMDMVVNHTSDQHRWFQEAMSSPDSPYRDYYIIRKGRKRHGKLLPPTDWESTFTGSAWERIGDTEEYYLHLFCKEQPDLNWENPKVREEVADILRFYMDKGVDGFRFDVFNVFSKVYPLKNDPTGGISQKGSKYYIDGPRMHEFLKELNRNALSLYDSYTVGESFRPSEENARLYVMESSKEVDSLFNFAHLESDNVGGLKFIKKKFDLRQFKAGLFGAQEKYYDGGWNTLVLENHDNPRCNSRFGINTKKYRYEASTFLALITFMGFGVPFIYQGQEIGMTNADFKSMDELKDPVSHFVYDLMRKFGTPAKIAFRFIRYGARDHARVPMQWDASRNAGFSQADRTWQKMNGNYKEINAEKDLAAEKSVYRFYQRLIEIKKTNRTAIYGRTKEYDHENKKVIAYSRSYEGKRLLVLGNFSESTVKDRVPEDFKTEDLTLLLSNYSDAALKEEFTLRPYEALLLEEKTVDIPFFEK